ncbi:MAG: tetratricopeptide repeat protein [Nitrospiraceae bacterium]|nr:tetratricopeptide repeat protein [Nitrospiraceae bacterium]
MVKPDKRIDLFINVKDSKVRSGDGVEYNLTPHFLYLYYYLALKRLHDPSGSGGFADADEIISLPYWERNDLGSVGKQIRRHIVDMEKKGLNIIEAQQKVYGPFRFMLLPDEIHIDVPIFELMDLLDVRHIHKLKQEEESAFYKYVESMWEGDDSFDKGILKKALTFYEKASEAAINIELKITAKLKVGRTLERLGDFKNATLICEEILNYDGINAVGLCKTNIFYGWLNYRQRHFQDAEEHYYKAIDNIRGKKYHRLFGDIYNCLGLLRKERGQDGEYDEALRFYQLALEYWSLSEYYYGIQAIYFNIGNLYVAWGDKVGPDNKSIKLYNYQKAIEWTKRCVSLCKKMDIANETSQDHILLAELYLKLNDLDNSLEYAKTANDMALVSGNKRDIGYSYEVLGKIYLRRKLRSEAESAFRSCLEYLKKIDISDEEFREREEEIRKLLDQ